MSRIRERALRRFDSMAWPTPQEEEWRRTDITAFDFELDGGEDEVVGTQDTGADVESGLGGLHGSEAIQKSGSFDSAIETAGFIRFESIDCTHLSVESDLRSKGVYLASLSVALNELDSNPGLRKVRSHLEKSLLNSIEQADNRFQVWNYGEWSHGVVLYIPPGVEIDAPFLFDFRVDQISSRTIPFVFVMADKDSKAEVIQITSSSETAEMICNSGSQFFVSEGASLSFSMVQALDSKSAFFSHSNAVVERNATLNCFEGIFGTKLCKTRLEVDLKGEGDEVQLSGICFAGDSQHMDIRTVQRHQAPNGTSRTFYKGAVMGEARTIYQGLIDVSLEGEKTDAYLTNKNLILNDGARADSIPGLKIRTNDVKCSHGSTTGKLDESELFYLMTRGLSRKESERALITAYFEDVIAKAPASLHDILRRLIEEKLSERAEM